VDTPGFFYIRRYGLVDDERFDILEMNTHKELPVRQHEVSMRADMFLASRMPHRSRNEIQKILADKRITLSGKAVKPSYKVKADDIFWLKTISSDLLVGDNSDIKLDYIYEDKHLIVINKQPDIVVHPSGRRVAGTVIQGVLLHMKEDMTGNPDLMPRLLHRIDRETTGVLLISKYQEIHTPLQWMFEHRKISKQYITIVEGAVEKDSGEIELPLARDRSTGIGVKISVNHEHGQHALTRYEVVERLDGFTVVRAKPLTGRQHQIRVHMAAIGHPVVDDLVYKDEKVFLEYVRRGLNAPEGFHILGRHALHAEQLTCFYPPKDKEVTFVAPLWPDMKEFIEKHRKLS